MFYVFSKILAFFWTPFIWVLLLLFFALVIKRKTIRARLLKYAFWLMLFFTNPLLFNWIMGYWEGDGILKSNAGNYEIGILLGGYLNDEPFDTKLLELDEAGNRLITTLELYRADNISKILISGGNGNLYSDDAQNEAHLVKSFLMRMGVEEEDILMDDRSQNTNENAVYSKQVLEKEYSNLPKCLLITSAYHQRRARWCMSKQGIYTQSFPCDFIHQRINEDPRKYLFPDPTLFKKWQIVLKEWIGIAVYKIMGYC